MIYAHKAHSHSELPTSSFPSKFSDFFQHAIPQGRGEEERKEDDEENKKNHFKKLDIKTNQLFARSILHVIGIRVGILQRISALREKRGRTM